MVDFRWKKNKKQKGLSKLKNHKDHWSRHHPISGILGATYVSSDSASLVRLPRPFGLRKIHHSPLQCCSGSRSSRFSCAYGIPTPLHLSLATMGFHGCSMVFHIYSMLICPGRVIVPRVTGPSAVQ